MVQNYQDAMSICRWAGCPDAFITFTCNPQWLEIKRALLLGQQLEDRPDLVTRVFKIKLKELINDIHKHYNKRGAYCDPDIIANNKENSFRKFIVPNNNSSQTLKPLRNPQLRTRTIASSSQLPKLKQSQNISDYNVFYT